MLKVVQSIKGNRGSGVGGGRPVLAAAIAFVGHVALAIPVLPIWQAVPHISAGDPPPSIAIEIVSNGDAPSSMASVDPANNKFTLLEEKDATERPTLDNSSEIPPALAAPDLNVKEGITSSVLKRKAVESAKPQRKKMMATRVNPVERVAEFEPTSRTEVKNSVQTNAYETSSDESLYTFGHGGDITALSSEWKSRLLSHLERYKRYPEAAKNRREEGSALVGFTLDREGHVLTFYLARSSGSNELDDAAQAMVERASPVPSLPDDVIGQTVQLTVPVRFSIR